jgi:cellobionic acid phosphorylase
MLRPSNDGERYELDNPLDLPRAAGFLWNRKMMIQVTCRGYAVAQFMQPEPAKYAYAPNLEARTFMQPEQPYYAHHPGRFFYVKDEDTGAIFSAPYEPVRAKLDRFVFSAGGSDLRWSVEKDGLAIEMCLCLAAEEPVELWRLEIRNGSRRPRRISIYPYFPIGYMSWMNQGAQYRPELCGIVARCVTPYQKVADYFKHKGFKDQTFFLASDVPSAWEARQEAFEGEGGLHHPTGVEQEELARGDALYETPAAVLQYRVELPSGASRSFRFLFGPACDDAEIARVRETYLEIERFSKAASSYARYIARGTGCLQIETPDAEFSNFVNHWLGRQVFYHGDVNRLTTDPQTRNYLQDNMGMSYIDTRTARAAFLHSLSQQEPSGAMPDGIILIEGAELKYINQVPHTDHCVWLPVCLQAYLDETDDYAILDDVVLDREGCSKSAFDRITAAMRWLEGARDERGLSYIAQGDWCDPMNMVGYKGKGVSGWLTVATAYALGLWATVCDERGAPDLAEEFRAGASACNAAVIAHLWDGRWFGRGITDDGTVFGVSTDPEGSIFLNVQSWSMLSGAADEVKQKLMIQSIAGHLETPHGVMTLAPAFTGMREDVGRITQKFPGSAENGSVYNHDSTFYVFALYLIGEHDRAFRILRQLIPGPDPADYQRRGQLPIFVPNYYRGAYYQNPRTAGRSSMLFNTGTVSWMYRCLVEGLFGVKGCRRGLVVRPQLPSHWNWARVVRRFRGATFEIEMRRDTAAHEIVLTVDGRECPDGIVTEIEAGRTYRVDWHAAPWDCSPGHEVVTV